MKGWLQPFGSYKIVDNWNNSPFQEMQQLRVLGEEILVFINDDRWACKQYILCRVLGHLNLVLLPKISTRDVILCV